MFDENSFNFDAMKKEVGVDPFAQESKRYAKDERFYTLAKDQDGNGAALIRFLPDADKRLLQSLYKINTTIIKNGKKRFVSEFSPSTIGQPCPFQEEWQDLWNKNIKENVVDDNGVVTQYGSKAFGRAERFVTNIKVLRDPANPENVGKIFLYEMSGAMRTKIKNALEPSEQDIELGAKPKELFNPLKGHSFRLVAKKGSNGQINYDSSEVVQEVDSIYNSVEEALDEIQNKTHKLSTLMEPEAFMTYEELQKKKDWVTFQDQAPVQTAPLTAEVATQVAQVAEVQPAQPAETQAPQTTQAEPAQPATPAKSDSLDDLLDGLV